MTLLVSEWWTTRLAALTVAAWVATFSGVLAGDGAGEVPQEVLDFGMDLGLAELIVDECGRDFRVNRPYSNAWVREFEKKYGKADWISTDVESVAFQRRLQANILKYAERRQVVFSKPETWCTAGRAEMADKTRIGRLLIAR